MPWAPDYVTAAELAAYVRADESVDGADLAIAATGASRAVDRHCGRQFGQVTAVEARYYTARYDDELKRWLVDIDDLMTATGLLVAADRDGDGTYSEAIDDFVLRPRNAAARGKPWEQILVRPTSANKPTDGVDGVEVIAQPGWTAVPDPVKLATKLQASRFFSRREAPFGIAGSPDAGSEMRLLARVDPDLTVALADFRKRAWSA